MSNDYINANDKAQCLHGTVGDAFNETMDPYCFSDRHWPWIDDIRQWPAVDFPAIYTYLIDTPGGYTREKLMYILRRLSIYLSFTVAGYRQCITMI